jgi:hypothetical protein
MLHDALLIIGYRVVVLSYLVMYCGDKVLSHLGGVCSVHNLTYGVPLSHDVNRTFTLAVLLLQC